MPSNRAKKILETLKKTFQTPKRSTMCREPFETLIRTIVSQNTAERNTVRAFEELSERFRITPEALAKTHASNIEQCLRSAGLYRTKAKAIKQVSRTIEQRYGGDLTRILSLPLEEARESLMELPGVGPKTADVVLLFCSGAATIPIDTHVNRVSKRLALAPANGDYEETRRSLQSRFDVSDFLAVHVLLITLGREYCRARKPSCKDCPVNRFCPSGSDG